jgi:protein dithiol:quinone oxidoreductase
MLGFLRVRRRLVTALLGVCCFLMFGYALFAQYQLQLEPCPLCIFQRIATVGLGIALLVAAAIPGRWRMLGNVSAALVLVVGLAGMGVSARHLYIQSLPPGKVPVCGASLDYMMDVFPLADVLRKVLTGSGECAKIDWTLLGLSMPGWVMIGLFVLTSLGFLANWRSKRSSWSRG